ncbi:hypothetical protein AAG570_010156 [Ranatra chinensis]|uniref:Ketosynthase family 3 (KS3) domain-containing protein n=1 Tax=Ranatra chinensis TaxID=642074 RepID=A0ABD0YNW0_9HEMI
MKCATGYGMMGRARTMNANRISYYFNAKGPSVVIGCTWEESLEILSVASQLISEGHAVAAIVGVTNMITSPEVSFAIDCMGRLTQGNQTKSFSNDADGYNRSEACVVFFLQRADHARRSYGSVVKVLSTNFGSREQTITGHSPDLYTRFLRQAYDGIDRTKLGFVELDGSANKNTDAMELNTANEVINEGREKPLLVGSIKSNLGHTETASGFVSIVKALIALDTGIIPPNLHFSQPNTGSPALTQGKLQVTITTTTMSSTLYNTRYTGHATPTIMVFLLYPTKGVKFQFCFSKSDSIVQNREAL